MHSFSPAEIWKIAEVMDMSVEDVLRELHEAGLDSMPGGGAEILTEETRMRVSRLKVTADQWLEAMKASKKSRYVWISNNGYRFWRVIRGAGASFTTRS